MSRFWALTVVTDTGGAEALLAGALAGALVAVVGPLTADFSEHAARKKLQAISDKIGTVFMGNF
jgi:purine-cytosine permease-like protein